MSAYPRLQLTGFWCTVAEAGDTLKDLLSAIFTWCLKKQSKVSYELLQRFTFRLWRTTRHYRLLDTRRVNEIKWVETLTPLLKHLSRAVVYKLWFSEGRQELLPDARGRGRRVTHTFHLYQLCCLFHSAGSHKISFLRKKVPLNKQNEQQKNICLSIYNVTKPQLRLSPFLAWIIVFLFPLVSLSHRDPW